MRHSLEERAEIARIKHEHADASIEEKGRILAAFHIRRGTGFASLVPDTVETFRAQIRRLRHD